MEKIKIKSIEMKGPNKTICVVRYVAMMDENPRPEKEATLNTKWQSQEINYLEKDVGLGGEVSVLIEQRGQYTNITKVDFGSAVPSGQVLKEVQNGERSLNGQEQKPQDSKTFATGYETFKSNSIIAQCLVKAVIGQTRLCEEAVWTIGAAVDIYKEALELLG